MDDAPDSLASRRLTAGGVAGTSGRYGSRSVAWADAQITDRFSNADIAEICQNAKMKALQATLAHHPEAMTT